jgi:hypothetical protein
VGQIRKAVSASSRPKRQRDVLGVIIRGRGVRYSAARQRQVIGVDIRPRKWLEISKHDSLFDQVMHTAVAGRCLAIHWLFLACDKSASARENKAVIANFVKSVRSHGGEIYEVGSGRCTTSTKARSDMISDAQEAVDAILRGRVPRTLNRLGHPRRNWTKQQQQIVWTKWFNPSQRGQRSAMETPKVELPLGLNLASLPELLAPVSVGLTPNLGLDLDPVGARPRAIGAVLRFAAT